MNNNYRDILANARGWKGVNGEPEILLKLHALA